MTDDSGGPGPPITSMDTGGNVQNNSKDLHTDIRYDFNNLYSKTDQGPYFVYIEHINKNLGRLFPIKIGHYLQEVEVFRSDIIDIKALGIKKVKVIFKTSNVANMLIQHPIIKKNELVAYIPYYYTKKKGIIRMVDTFFSEDCLKKSIISEKTVLEVKRMKRKVFNSEKKEYEYVDRQMIIVTFLGNQIPKDVVINLVRFEVEPYIHPVVQCFNCLRYGHTASQCKGKSRCKKCTEEHNEENSCVASSPYCAYCKCDSHSSISKDCPMYKRQYNIKKVMAFQNASFKEAETIIDNPSYSKVVTNNRFSLLRTIDNFPDLPNTSNASNKTFVQKPKIPLLNLEKKNPISKKRKVISPPHSPSSKTIAPSQSTFTSKPIIPNPYREEFIIFKESLISQVSSFINNVFISQNITSISEKNIREHLNSVLTSDSNAQNISDVTIISDDDNESTY